MDVRKALFETYWKIQRLIVPKLKYSQDIYEEVLRSHIKPDTNWLDIGCGHKILPTWRWEAELGLAGTCKMIVGVDRDLPSLKNHRSIDLRVKADTTDLPFRSKTFDLATANMVVEHSESPAVQFREINRILKPGGLLIFHTPNLFGYNTILGRLVPKRLRPKLIYFFQGRKEEDVFVTHYKANSAKVIRHLASKSGFEILQMSMIVSAAQFVIVPPLVILELIWIRILMTRPFRALRTNIIAILRKASELAGPH